LTELEGPEPLQEFIDKATRAKTKLQNYRVESRGGRLGDKERKEKNIKTSRINYRF
jgi:hypothetical protein